MRASGLLLKVIAIGFLGTVGGCASVAPPRPSAAIATPIIEAPDAAFIVAASMNDTWNTVGQILVRTDNVIYESRAQMLGIYGIRYRGERFLIRTHAVVMEKPTDGLRTRVLAMEMDGKPKHSVAANALLAILQKRVPEEIGKYTLPVTWKGKPKPARKKR